MTNLTIGDIRKIFIFFERYHNDECGITIDQKNDIIIFTQELSDGSYETTRYILSDLIKDARKQYKEIHIVKNNEFEEKYYSLYGNTNGKITFDSYKIIGDKVIFYRYGFKRACLKKTDKLLNKLKTVD